ncbi:MAG: carboxypeptidase regulatory-like domain-containing protein [Gemmatimonadota bacterium]|jgi:hypothetical protein
MHTSIAVRSLVLAAALSAAIAAEASGQGSAAPIGQVRGVVYDSLAEAPLTDAAVFLWGTPYRSVTDADGRFVIDSVPPGEYTLLYFHTRLGELGISPGPTTVRVPPGDSVYVALGTPSMFTVMASQCLMQERGRGTGIIAGTVRDAATGMGMPHAQVSLSWLPEGSKEPLRLTFETDGQGWYRACEVPSGIPIVATARFMDRQGLRREISVREGARTQATFELSRLTPAHINGHVHDAGSGDGVGDVEVWLRGTAYRTITGPGGQFTFGDVPPGTYMMFARHLRYGTKQDTLVVPDGRDIDVDMRVDTRPIEMAPITVEVESRTQTERAMGGVTITRASIDKVRGKVRDAADIIRSQHMAGVIVRRNHDGTLCVGVSQGQVRMMQTGCVPMVIFINGVRATNTNLALQMPPESVDHIVIYRPIEAGDLFGAGSANGILMIYTRAR